MADYELMPANVAELAGGKRTVVWSRDHAETTYLYPVGLLPFGAFKGAGLQLDAGDLERVLAGVVLRCEGDTLSLPAPFRPGVDTGVARQRAVAGGKLDVIAAGLWTSPEKPPAEGVLVLVEVAEAFPESVDISVYRGRTWSGRDSLTVALGKWTGDGRGWWVQGVGFVNALPFSYPSRVTRWASINAGEG